jgi:hypothetical protein
MKVLAINLKSRTDRLASITRELKRMDLWENTTLVEGSVIPPPGGGVAGIADAHRRCIEIAMKENYEMVLIFQDDCKFLVSKDEFHSQINTFLETAPSDWEGLWFGSFYSSYDNSSNIYLKPHTFVQDTACLFHKRYFPKLLDYYTICRDKYIETQDDLYNIDQYIGRDRENAPIRADNIYVLKTKLCGQADNYSDRMNCVMNGGHYIPL